MYIIIYALVDVQELEPRPEWAGPSIYCDWSVQFEATLKIHIVKQLEVVGGFYCLALPMAFYPDYRKIGVGHDKFVYEFSYEV